MVVLVSNTYRKTAASRDARPGRTVARTKAVVERAQAMATPPPVMGSGIQRSPQERRQRRDGEIVVSAPFAAKAMNPFIVGAKLGWVYRMRRADDPVWGALKKDADMATRVPICALGPVYYNNTRLILAIAQGSSHYFLAQWEPSPRLWAHTGAPRLSAPALSLRQLARTDKVRAQAYANDLVGHFTRGLAPSHYGDAMHEATRRYGVAIQALVQKRIIEAAAAGFPRVVSDFASGCDETWKARDLTHPKVVTLRHAILSSLVLALMPSEASGLIQLASLMEYGVPIVDADTAPRIYNAARHRLTGLCSVYFMDSYLTDWQPHGSIAKLFGTMFLRIMADTLRHTGQAAKEE